MKASPCIRSLCFAVLLCLLPALGMASEAPWQPDPAAIEQIVSEAFMKARYDNVLEPVSIRYTITSPYAATVYHKNAARPAGTAAVDTIVEYALGEQYDGTVDQETLKGKVNNILNDMYTVSKSGVDTPDLIDFEPLYATKTLTTFVHKTEMTPWSFDQHRYSPTDYAVRLFLFRDGPDSILEEKVYAFILLGSSGGNIGWLCTDDAVIKSLTSALVDDPLITYTWLDKEKPLGRVTIAAEVVINVRAGGGTEYDIVGQVRPGEVFDSRGEGENGWYEITLKNGKTAFVSPRMADYEAY